MRRQVMIAGMVGVVGWLHVSGIPACADETSSSKASSAAASETDRAVLEALEEAEPIRVSMEFQDANLKDVLRAFSQQTGLNFIASEDVEDRPLTIYLEDVTVLDALDHILAASNTVYTRQPGSQIYLLRPTPPAPPPEIVTETRIYRLKFARVSTSRLAKAADAFSSITPFEAAQQAASTSGGGAGGGGGGLGGGRGFGGGGGGTSEELGVDKVLEKLLTERGKLVVDERTNSLVVTDVPNNFPRLESALKALDVKTAQVLIETELLETTLSKLKDLGIEYGSGSEGSMVTLTPGVRTTMFPLDWLPGRKTIATTTFDTEGAVVSLSGSATQSAVYSLGLIDATQINAVLQALERDTDTKILARPKVLTLDNESAVIKLTTNQAVGFETTTGQATETTTVTPERMTTGIILSVTPQINDGDYVTMLVEPSVTKVVAAQVSPPSGSGSVVDPKTRSARALVRIHQGDALVLGGLIDRSEEEVLQQVPILAQIPVLGEVFKNRETNNSESELIVFVTPRILTEPPEQTLASTIVAPGDGGIGSSRQELIDQALNRLEQRD